MRIIDVDELKERLGIADKCDNCSDKMKSYCDGNPSFALTCELICNAPTVDAELARHGEWVKMRGMMPPEYMGLKECNKCGWHIHPLGRTAFDKTESEFRYCPRCGAKMNNQFANGGKKVGDKDAAD